MKKDILDLNVRSGEKNINEKKILGRGNNEFFYEEVDGFKLLFDHLCEIINNNKDNSNIVIFFDIQGVLIKNNNFHEALSFKVFEDRLKNICREEDENFVKISRFGRFYDSQLTDNLLPVILNNLKNFDFKEFVELCLLTFARYSVDRERALKKHGILDHFDKQIWAGGINKGLVMVEYLKSRKQTDNLIVVFVDDKISHLKSVYDAIKKEQQKQESKLRVKMLKSYLYTQDSVVGVSEEDFDEFWYNIIKVYKKTSHNLPNYKFKK